MHKTQDEEKEIKKHNITCVGHHYAKDTRRREGNKKHNITCVGHHYAQDTRRRQTNKTTKHNMCWTPLCIRHKTKTNK